MFKKGFTNSTIIAIVAGILIIVGIVFYSTKPADEVAHEGEVMMDDTMMEEGEKMMDEAMDGDAMGDEEMMDDTMMEDGETMEGDEAMMEDEVIAE